MSTWVLATEHISVLHPGKYDNGLNAVYSTDVNKDSWEQQGAVEFIFYLFFCSGEAFHMCTDLASSLS